MSRFPLAALRAGVLAVLGLATGCRSPRPTGEAALLAHALDAAGGRTALARATRLQWEGEATVYDGQRRIDLGVQTDVVPLGRVRSVSWLRDRGPSTARSMEFDGPDGWIVRGGERTPMPAALARHERAQFATYGLMRLVPLTDAGVRLGRLPADSLGRAGLRVHHPHLGDADLYFDADGRLRALVNRVPGADGGEEIAQRFEFDGTVVSNGVRWPRTLRLTQRGQPYFDLHLRRFTATADSATG